ncbi:sulfotransferase family protein [Actinospongicola halichondriae]|uniref:sulfotransferase family protein n=1 Tax=Actinospongicola halichondriae TaxID=3236844 RepID=UPI003D4E09BF
MTSADHPATSGGWDFLVIGAQKAGTTTLHHLLGDHPRLALPTEKEAPIFHETGDPTRVETQARQLLGPPDGRLRGKATPQYMCAPGTAANVAAVNPDMRIIALFRDPVDRARSHWAMRARFRTDERPFAEAIRQQLDTPPSLDGPIEEEDGYIRFGEYGRVLLDYRAHFPAEAMLVLHMDELAADPVGVVARVTAHLGVEAHQPGAAGERFNVASREARFPRAEAALWRLLPYDKLWSAASPSMRQRAGAVLDRLQVNRPSPEVDASLPDDVTERLVEHFRADLALLDASDLSVPAVTVNGNG